MSYDGEYDSSQDGKQPVNTFRYIAHYKKWLDIDITETDTLNAPAFSKASKLKKFEEVSLVLPSAENMVRLWDFKRV